MAHWLFLIYYFSLDTSYYVVFSLDVKNIRKQKKKKESRVLDENKFAWPIFYHIILIPLYYFIGFSFVVGMQNIIF